MKRFMLNIAAVSTILIGGNQILTAQTPEGQACCSTVFTDAVCCGDSCKSGWFKCSAEMRDT